MSHVTPYSTNDSSLFGFCLNSLCEAHLHLHRNSNKEIKTLFEIENQQTNKESKERENYSLFCLMVVTQARTFQSLENIKY